MKISEFMQVMDYLRDIINGTEFEGHVFAVGGCVRDKNLGSDIKDIDLVVDLLNGGIVFAKHLQARGYTEGTVVVYENYGTAMVRLKEFPGVELEFVQTRKESYHDAKTRNPDTCFGTIEDDCKRRDFTINALYYNISEGKEYDFNGNGLNDLKKGIIDTCGDPDIIFDEDPLRILRAVRFSSKLRYPISERTKAGIRRHKGRLDIISQERITDEINKMLSGPNPEDGVELLHTLGLCEIVLPEMQEILAHKLYEVVKDIHNIKVQAIENNLDQLTLMLSYISYKVNPLIFRASMKRMRYSSETVDKVFLYASLLDKAIFVSEFHSTVDLRELAYLAKTKENYVMLLALTEAIKQRIWDKMKQDPPYNMFGYTLPVNGNDIMDTLGIGPCQKIKMIQDDLLCDAFVNPNLSKEECIELIKIRFAGK